MVLRWLVLVLAMMVGIPANAQSAGDLLISARAAYDSRNQAALADYTQQLHSQDYILAPYADYWLMLLRLNEADETSVHDFLNQYTDYPFADRLRGEWLKTLGKQQNWQAFFDELPHLQREDTAVDCYAIEARAMQGDADILTEAKSLWMSGTEQPANCNAVFDLMQQHGVLKENDIWARFRLALQEGRSSLAKGIAQRGKGFDKANLKLMDRVLQSPQNALEKKAVGSKSRFSRELGLYAIERMALSNPAQALQFWKQVQDHHSSEDQGYLWGRIAMQAARLHDASAMEWFGRANELLANSEIYLDKEQLAWKARAAIRAGDWAAVQSAIMEMPQIQQDEGAWRYWKGRALKEQKQVFAANEILSPLSRERHYYGLLAKEELGDSISEPPTLYKATEQEIHAVRSMAGIQRAIELQRLDFRGESRIEWAYATRDLDDKQMIAAAEVAADQGWYDLAIITADKTTLVHDFSLRYPTPYRNLMQGYARGQQLDDAWVYGLARQESRFMDYAKSSVGAAGVMQLMPATAKWVAKKMGMNGYRHDMIHKVDTNIQLGTYYLRYVLDLMNGQEVMATAAYNAGPGRAKRWMAATPLEGAVYAETIPFNETRYYVQKVMANAHYYAQRLGAKLVPLKQRLGIIPGNGSNTFAAQESSEKTE